MSDDAEQADAAGCRTGKAFRGAMPFMPPLADSRNYPHPVVFAVPVQSGQTGDSQEVWSRQPNLVRMVDHARTALFLIGKVLAPVKVWAPAYHCPAMIEPFLAAGCDVALYPVTDDLQPAFGFLALHVSSGDAMIATRFFGFDCGVAESAAFCTDRGLVLIEDLAHATYFDRLHGQFAVTSLVKFLPMQCGGELLLPPSSDFIATVDSQYRLLRPPAIARLRRLVNRAKRRWSGPVPPSSGYRYFDSGRAFRGLARADRRVLCGSTHAEVCSRRQQNYRYLLQHLRDVDGGSPLFDVLPPNVVPYVFPFLLDDAAGFDRLRNSAVQVLRWEEIALADCKVSAEYRERLVQLPLHQNLSRQQIEHIVFALTT
jgi:hypothetical protein